MSHGNEISLCSMYVIMWMINTLSIHKMMQKLSLFEKSNDWKFDYVTPGFKNKTRFIICVPRKSTYTTIE